MKYTTYTDQSGRVGLVTDHPNRLGKYVCRLYLQPMDASVYDEASASREELLQLARVWAEQGPMGIIFCCE